MLALDLVCLIPTVISLANTNIVDAPARPRSHFLPFQPRYCCHCCARRTRSHTYAWFTWRCATTASKRSPISWRIPRRCGVLHVLGDFACGILGLFVYSQLFILLVRVYHGMQGHWARVHAQIMSTHYSHATTRLAFFIDLSRR